jgi:hypothetical protein
VQCWRRRARTQHANPKCSPLPKRVLTFFGPVLTAKDLVPFRPLERALRRSLSPSTACSQVPHLGEGTLL